MLRKLIDLIRERLFPPAMVSISVSKQLIANASAHGAGDYLNDTTAQSWVLKNAAREKGGSLYITKFQVIAQPESQTFRTAWQVFTRAPITALTDNGAAASPVVSDEQFFEDEIAVPALLSRGAGSYAVATPSTTGNLPMAVTCLPGSRDLYLAGITLDATTFTATERLTIKVKIERFKTER